MLYLLEFYIDKFNQIPVELNLTCSIDGSGKFVATFGGQDQFAFEKIVSTVDCFVA
jgi:hypothetical protein